MRRRLIGCLCLALIALQAPAAAQSTDSTGPAVSEARIDQYLLGDGNYPAEVVQQLPSEAKLALFQEQAVYISHHTERQTLVEGAEGPAVPAAATAPAAGMVPLNLDSCCNFTHSVIVSDVPDSVPGRMEYQLTYSWQWHYNPMWTLTDKFGLAWSDNWEVLRAEWRYTAYGKWKHPSYATVFWYRTRTWGGTGYPAEYTPGTGIGWEYDIVDFFGHDGRPYETYKHTGWGAVRLARWSTKAGTWDNTSAVGKYFHREYQIGTPQFTFSESPSVGLSSSWGYDSSSAAMAYWDWFNYK